MKGKTALLDGTSKSCGCIQREKTAFTQSATHLTCATCQQEKPKSDFRRTSVYKTARYNATTCQHCERAARCIAHRTNISVRARNLCNSARARSLSKGWPFGLTPEWIVEQFERQEYKCFYSGVKFDMDGGLLGPSLDRRDSSLFYTQDNIVIATFQINTMKSNIPENDFIALCRKVATR